MRGITVVIPTIAERQEMLGQAVASVMAQTELPKAIVIVPDQGREAAAITRTRGLNMVKTEWVAFLDDDDLMGPDHLETLHRAVDEQEGDFAFSWFTVEGGIDPFPMNEHREFDIADPHQTTVTVLVRTDAIQAVGGFLDSELEGLTDGQGNRAGEEFRMTCRLARAGYKIVKVHERTWVWRHHGKNTSGQPRPVESPAPQ